MSVSHDEVNQKLALPLDPSKIRQRKGPNGKKLDYLSGGDVILALNDALTPLGWSRSIARLDVDVDQDADQKTGETKASWSAVARATVRIQLHPTPGVVVVTHEDVGHGLAQAQKSRGDAIELAEKSAVTDAMKRAAHSLGPRLGLALYHPKDEREELGLVADQSDALAVNFKDAPAGDQRAAERQREEQRAEEIDAKAKPLEQEPTVIAARWLLELKLSDVIREALKTGARPGAEGSDLLRGMLPPEPTTAELQSLAPLSAEDLADLERWPPKDPLTRPLLPDVHRAAVEAIGDEEARALWRELGVELRRGAEVTGYVARLFVAGAGALAKSRLAETSGGR